MYRHTCLKCANRSHSLQFAERFETEWKSHPVDIGERTCAQCGKSRHWWYFWDWDHLEPGDH